MSMQKIVAADEAEFDTILSEQVTKGFIITHRSDGSATLQRPRKIPPAAWLLILIPGAGWLILFILFVVTKSKTDVVEICS